MKQYIQMKRPSGQTYPVIIKSSFSTKPPCVKTVKKEYDPCCACML